MINFRNFTGVIAIALSLASDTPGLAASHTTHVGYTAHAQAKEGDEVPTFDLRKRPPTPVTWLRDDPSIFSLFGRKHLNFTRYPFVSEGSN